MSKLKKVAESVRVTSTSTERVLIYKTEQLGKTHPEGNRATRRSKQTGARR